MERRNEDQDSGFYEWIMLVLYAVVAFEYAIIILMAGGGWWALLSPILAAFGPRHWKSQAERVRFYCLFVGFGAVCILIFWLSPPYRRR